MRARASRGVIVWLTGLSGAGKSTLACAVRDAIAATHAVEVLDGDDIRAYLSKDLGFSREDRETNIRRIGFVARLLARHGVIAIAAAISPYAATRDEVRTLAEREGIAFVEVFVNAALDSLVDTRVAARASLRLVAGASVVLACGLVPDDRPASSASGLAPTTPVES